MLTKPKQKQKSLRDMLLFASPFAITVDYPLQDCEDRIREIARPKRGLVRPLSREVSIHKTSDNAYDFVIQLKLHDQRDFFSIPEAKCVGVLFRDSWSEKTVIQGRFSIEFFMLIPLIVLWVFFLISVFANAARYVYGAPLLAIFTLLYALLYYLDYYKFQTVVYEAFQHS